MTVWGFLCRKQFKLHRNIIIDLPSFSAHARICFYNG